MHSNISRVGATKNPNARISAYQSQGYAGTAYVAETRNMKQAEGRLLRACQSSCDCNIQRSSNAPSQPGYVYGIREARK